MGHREDLLAAARKCMETKGYAHTTARDLVAESNTNLASIGYHFGSKEALLQMALQQAQIEYTSRILDSALAPEAEHITPERMGRTWELAIASFDNHRPVVIAFYEALVQSLRNEELRANLATTYREVRGVIADALESTGAGETPEEAQALASFFMGAYDGVGIQLLIDPESVPTARELFESAAKYFLMTEGRTVEATD